jgi:hypothetical protein
MLETLSTLLRLYSPPAILALGVVIALCVKPEGGPGEDASRSSLALNLRILNLSIGAPIRISTGFSRIMIVFASLLSAGISIAVADYSKVFRKNYKMSVHYDGRGIDETIGNMDPKDLLDIKFSGGSPAYDPNGQGEWFRQMSTIARSDCGAIFDNPREIDTAGHSVLEVEKVDWRRYRVANSYGMLFHNVGKARRPCLTFFRLVPSEYDELRISTSLLLKTRYQQLLSDSGSRQSESQLQKMDVLALTSVRVVPWPRVGRTLYLARVGADTYTPIAYVEYH